MMETSRNLEIIFNRIKNTPKNFIKFFLNNLPEKTKLCPNNNRYIIAQENANKKLLCLKKMHINKCKKEIIPIDNLFISQIENILSVLQHNNIMRKTIGGFLLPKDIKEYISILKNNLSNNDKNISNNLSLQYEDTIYGRSRWFVISTVLVTVLSILLGSIMIFVIIKKYLKLL